MKFSTAILALLPLFGLAQEVAKESNRDGVPDAVKFAFDIKALEELEAVVTAANLLVKDNKTTVVTKKEDVQNDEEEEEWTEEDEEEEEEEDSSYELVAQSERKLNCKWSFAWLTLSLVRNARRFLTLASHCFVYSFLVSQGREA